MAADDKVLTPEMKGNVGLCLVLTSPLLASIQWTSSLSYGRHWGSARRVSTPTTLFPAWTGWRWECQRPTVLFTAICLPTTEGSGSQDWKQNINLDISHSGVFVSLQSHFLLSLKKPFLSPTPSHAQGAGCPRRDTFSGGFP